MKYRIETTRLFDKWFAGLKDARIKIRLLARFTRIENGHFGDYKTLGNDLLELRFFFGAGLRIYYTIQGNKIVFLLVGGDKSTQKKDIEKARGLLKEMETKP